jgi:uncharacterized membrane protein
MSTKATTTLLVLLTALAFGVGMYIYPMLPAVIASHWDTAGNVNGMMPKFWGVFLLPFLMIFMLVVYLAVPHLDPMKGIHAFRKYYNIFWIILFAFMVYVYKVVLLLNIDQTSVDVGFFLGPALAVLYFAIGWILPHTKRNWFMGIRTPWTLSSDRVWDKTHKLGGILFKLSALGPLIAAFWVGLGDIPLVVLIAGPAILTALITIVYSYLEHEKEMAGGQ